MALGVHDFETSGGHAPQPEWPTDGVDPFAGG
jgi:hypothetical protein